MSDFLLHVTNQGQEVIQYPVNTGGHLLPRLPVGTVRECRRSVTTYYARGPVSGKDSSLVSRLPQGHDRISLNMWGSKGEESQRGRKRAGRGERGGESQIQGQTSWPDDLENHFPFPCL